MSTSVAEMVLYGITAVAFLVWVEALRFLVVSVRGGKKTSEEARFPEERPQGNFVYGSAEIEGHASELIQKASALLAEKSVRICERTEQSIVFQSPGEYLPGQTSALPAMQGQMQFTQLAERTTRVDYALAAPQVRILLILGFAFVAIGLAAILTGFFIIYRYVIPHPIAEVRWQTLQMLQVANFLWEPFMFGALYRKPASILRAEFDTFIHNLPFLKA
ncbi:MAG TPA: hypothetical protein VIH42_13160 [Thermoguttaceae bacterium]